MLIIKGLIIGIGKIIPGVSGSMLAISLGEYESMLYAVSNYFKDVVNNSKYLIKICIGIIISIVLFSNIILKSINDYYIYTMFLFAGFILGGSTEIRKDININYMTVIVSLVLLLLINKYIFSSGMILNKTFVYYMFGGFLDSVTMIIPGISGTAMLISYGCYNEVIQSITNMNLAVIIPFTLGIVIGVVLTVKFISYMFNNYKEKTYNIIIGISIATIIIMLIKGINNNTEVVSIIVSSILLVIGYFLSKKLTAILTVK